MLIYDIKTKGEKRRSREQTSIEKHQQRWALDLDLQINSAKWQMVYKNNYSCTLETNLRSFQLKLNHRAIVTNTQLNSFDLIDSSTCGFCNLENETLMHLFCDCHEICDFWEEVTLWLTHFFRRDINFTNFNKLFGFLIGNNLKLLNCILLNARFIIYSCKYSNRKPNLNLLFVTLQHVKKSEYIIAMRNNIFSRYLYKWNL